MGKGSGGGTNTVTNNSAPPPEVMAQYQKILDQANGVSGQNLNQYGGSMIAGFTPDQMQGFDTVRGAQGLSAPYLGQAQNMINQSQTPLWNSVQQWSPDNIQQYMNPYQKDVTDATMANINETNAQQNQQVVGDAISKGAWGGDRAGIAQAELARQQGLASNQTLAGLNAANYNQANTQFNTQQAAQLGANTTNNWLSSQGAYGEAALGNQAFNTALQGAGAQLSTGQQQQTLAQSALNIPYEQFLQQQSYPYQNLSWLSNISTGIGGGSGGTSSSTQPSPSGLSSGLGAALGIGSSLAGLGAFGGIGGTAAGAGWLIASDKRLKTDIDRIGKYKDYPLYEYRYKGDNVRNVGVMAQDVEKINPGAVRESGGYKMVDYSKLARGGAAHGFIPEYAMGGDIPQIDMSYIPSGMSIAHGGMGIPQAPHLTESPKDDSMSSALQMMASMGKSKPKNEESLRSRASTGFDMANAEDSGLGDMVSGFKNPDGTTNLRNPVNANGDSISLGSPDSSGWERLMANMGFARGGFADGGMTDENARKMLDLYDETTGVPSANVPVADSNPFSSGVQPNGLSPSTIPPVPSSQPRGLAPQASAYPDVTKVDNSGADPINPVNPWLSLAHAGFAMAAGQSPHAMQNIAAGASVGLQDLQKQKDQAADESVKQSSIKDKAEQLYQEALHNRATESIQQKTLDETAKYHDRELDLKARQKWSIDPNTGMPMNVYTGEMKNPYDGKEVPVDDKGNPNSNIPEEYFGSMTPNEITNYRNVSKKNQPKDVVAQQTSLASLVDQNTKVNDLVKQIPIASSGDIHTLTDFIDRNEIPVLSDPARGAATVSAAYDSLGNVLDNLKSTFSGTGRVLQAEFNTMKQELNASANSSVEMKAAVVGKIKKRLDEVTKDQLQYTNDVASGMAYMPSRFYKSPSQKRLEALTSAGDKPADPVTLTGADGNSVDNSPLSAPPPAASRVIDKVYSTPKGPMKWTAAGWLPAGAP